MKVLKRILFGIGILGISILGVPLGIYWIFTGKDLVSDMFESWIINFDDVLGL